MSHDGQSDRENSSSQAIEEWRSCIVEIRIIDMVTNLRSSEWRTEFESIVDAAHRKRHIPDYDIH